MKRHIFLIIIGTLVVTNVFTMAKLAGHLLCERSTYFINSRFACGHQNIVDKKEYVELKSQIKTFLDNKKTEGKVKIVAVWFRDLEGGPTFGINERVDFIPASLLKLPLVLTFLELAEDDPDILTQTMIYRDSTLPVPSQVFAPQDPIIKNKSYTIGELINHALEHSDNIASQLLFDYLNINYKDKPLSQTYRDLGILEPGTDLDMAAVNAKEYGSIFRQLYNVSFLNKDFSEKLLILLAQSDFRNGLNRGIPSDIKIAHKFGERVLENGDKQLHDCGIVYYPDNPYQLCIMTRGSNFDDLSDIIGEISKEVYQEFNSRMISK